MKDASMYWDIAPILSKNKIMNFVVGNRGGGKTYGSLFWSINTFLKKGKQFIYVRRFKTEFEDKATLLDKVAERFPNHVLEVKGMKCYCDNKLMGYLIPLTQANKKKSTNFSQVDKIIFDEFIIDNGTSHYLRNEVQILLDLYETVDRSRDEVRMLLLANSLTIVNPYFTYFNTFPKMDRKITLFKHMAIEMVAKDEFIQFKQQTRFGQMIKNTVYGMFNIENKFLRDNEDFIEMRPKKCQYMIGVRYLEKWYGFWYSKETGYLYMNETVDKTYPQNYALTCSDHTPNTIMLKQIKNMGVIKVLRTAYDTRKLRFENQVCKSAFTEFYNLL